MQSIAYLWHIVGGIYGVGPAGDSAIGVVGWLMSAAFHVGIVVALALASMAVIA